MKSWKSAPSKDCRPIQEFTVAPFAQHSPVNELHSIESKAFRFSFFLLTQKIEGVKHNCSLTVSEVFPVGAASGGQTRSPSADCQSANAREVGQPANHAYRAPAGWRKEGQWGSIAKRWSRRTGNPVKGRIESRSVELIYPVGGKPGARVQIACTRSARIANKQVGEGLKRATGRDEW